MSSDLDSRLRSLQQYAPSQNERIKLLSSPRFFQDPDNPFWLQLWYSVWVHQARVISDEDHKVARSSGLGTIDDSLVLPDVVPPSCRVMTNPDIARDCWNFNCTKFLIRSQYNKAEEFALSMCHDEDIQALVITGQPGIGKSAFLFRTLLRRLKFKLPTALQVGPNSALLFYEEGVKKFAQLSLSEGTPYNKLRSYSGPGRIWALVDTNQELLQPSPLFQEGPFFVVGASSPRPVCHNWVRRVSHEFFYMEQWSFAEVLQVRSLIKPHLNEKSLFYIHNRYGASLRDLFVYAGNTDQYESMVSEAVNQLPLSKLQQLLGHPGQAGENSHLLIFTGPSRTGITKPERRITSQYVLDKICGKVLELRSTG